MKRNIFFISDGTGITAEALGHSLMSQFEGMEFEPVTIPYVDDEEKALQAVNRINQAGTHNKIRPIVFATLVNPKIRHLIETSQAKVFDFFETFLEPIETELQTKSSYTVGKIHSAKNNNVYQTRIEAINFALASDDGIGIHHYKEADLILVGISRSGKTPTCLYLALQFGIKAANFPFTEDDIRNSSLPNSLLHHRKKLFGLTIAAERLQKIRTERRANSRYASPEQCRLEVQEVEALFNRFSIPFINTTALSIEEIATKILAETGIERRLF
ncbi:MAG: kinase/pyrophosphorylase [Proteobacteria bacterium]|nr:kinase/pyrophosphorylase [Pseudomonadota bacterium]